MGMLLKLIVTINLKVYSFKSRCAILSTKFPIFSRGFDLQSGSEIGTIVMLKNTNGVTKP